jgi:hypothetical protein
MTGPAGFVARWSRLKREPERERKVRRAAGALSYGAVEMGAAGKHQAAREAPGTDASTSQAFDPASLPPIDSITAGTDIRAFLRVGVPPTLTHAALRRAWASEPAIRDFIGIAENQWDFTDPTAIPGFGPLLKTDDVSALVTQAPGTLDKTPEAFHGTNVSAEEAPSSTSAPSDGSSTDAANADIGGSAHEAGAVGMTGKDEHFAIENPPQARRHPHGSALPQ